MKRSIQLSLVVMLFATLSLLSAFTAPKAKVCIRVYNDTGKMVTLHTGNSLVDLNNNVENELCLEEGRRLHFARNGVEGKVIVVFRANMNGKRIYLSNYR